MNYIYILSRISLWICSYLLCPIFLTHAARTFNYLGAAGATSWFTACLLYFLSSQCKWVFTRGNCFLGMQKQALVFMPKQNQSSLTRLWTVSKWLQSTFSCKLCHSRYILDWLVKFSTSTPIKKDGNDRQVMMIQFHESFFHPLRKPEHVFICVSVITG